MWRTMAGISVRSSQSVQIGRLLSCERRRDVVETKRHIKIHSLHCEEGGKWYGNTGTHNGSVLP